MKIYTKITLKKLNDHAKPGDKMPSHILVGADEDYKDKKDIGTLWMREGSHGAYLSGEMKKERTTADGVFYDGYVVVSVKELKELLDQVKKSNDPIEGLYSEGKGISIEDMPF